MAILAAGEGTRFKLGRPKPLSPICGQKLVDFPLSESLAFAGKVALDIAPVVVIGHGREQVEEYLGQKYSEVRFAHQPQRLGTADALKHYFALGGGTQKTSFTLVLCADTPLIRERHLSTLYKAMEEDSGADALVAVFRAHNSHGYGRIIEAGPYGPGFHIVEERDANDEVRKIDLVNSGLYLFRTPFLLEHLSSIAAGPSGEAYLTDIFQDERQVRAVPFSDANAFVGVNTLPQLCDAEYSIRREINARHHARGVHIIDHRHTYIDWDVEIGEGSVIHPNSFIYAGTQIGKGVTIEPCCMIRQTKICDGAIIKGHGHLEGAVVREGAAIGPFARIRPGSDIGKDAKIGNFVETKKVKIHSEAKVSHLSYVGDAEIGEQTNIGCGFITCNYDGKDKHKTTIGKRAFIGSDSQTVAPVSIGDDAYIGSGSTINKDVPDGAFAVARARQVTREGMAKRFKK